MLKFFVFLLLLIGEGALQQNRKCDCKQRFSLAKKEYPLLDKTFPTKANDTRDTCDFKCIEYCSKEIRKSIGGNESFVTDIGKKNICDRTFPVKSVFKDGVVMTGIWSLEQCTKGNIALQENLCCRYCKCYFSYLKPKERNINNAVRIQDYSMNLPNYFKPRFFACETVNHLEECEKDCRSIISRKIRYNDLNRIDLDNYDPLAVRDESNEICEYLITNLNRRINSPGIDLVVRFETGPRSDSLHKDIHLGNICCNRICNCDLVFKLKVNNVSVEDKVFNIEDNLPKRPLSYYCDDELTECIEDCKIAAGLTLRNEQIKKVNESVLNMEIFANFTTARKACIVYGKEVIRFSSSGVDVYLRYSTGDDYKKLYPYGQDLFIGNLCCQLFFEIELFPFNKCNDWNLLDIPFDDQDEKRHILFE